MQMQMNHKSWSCVRTGIRNFSFSIIVNAYRMLILSIFVASFVMHLFMALIFQHKSIPVCELKTFQLDGIPCFCWTWNAKLFE